MHGSGYVVPLVCCGRNTYASMRDLKTTRIQSNGCAAALAPRMCHFPLTHISCAALPAFPCVLYKPCLCALSDFTRRFASVWPQNH